VGLDINTERGQRSLKYERIMLDRIKNSFSVDLVETDKSMDAKVDGLVLKDGQLMGIFESKCRDMNYVQFQQHKSWLVTFDKLLDGKKLSQMLRVPFLGFLYLIPDQMIFYWKITDETGEFNFDFKVRKTKTQRTINGGEAIRVNAYLPNEYASEIT
tara:strand:- start:427 stop:897 length:471 start_codon:yes stop_codon:yes gene_type:complete